MKYHILSIGVSKHQNSFVNTLQFADKDATDFYTLFTSNISNIGYKKLLVNSEATLSEIRTALGKELKQAVGKDDAFFFFFSGHGSTAENQDGIQAFPGEPDAGPFRLRWRALLPGLQEKKPLILPCTAIPRKVQPFLDIHATPVYILL